MIETKIITEGGKPKFAILDYTLFEKFYDKIEELEDEIDAGLNVNTLGPKIPFEIVEAIVAGKSNIAAWREYRKLTQKELALKLKITQAAVSSLEKPNANPQKKTLRRVAKALGCPVQVLLGNN